MTFMRMLKPAIIHSSQRLNRDNNNSSDNNNNRVQQKQQKADSRQLASPKNPHYWYRRLWPRPTNGGTIQPGQAAHPQRLKNRKNYKAFKTKESREGALKQQQASSQPASQPAEVIQVRHEKIIKNIKATDSKSSALSTICSMRAEHIQLK